MKDSGNRNAAVVFEEFDHTARKLEFDEVLEVLASSAGNPRTRERLLATRPLSSCERIELSQGEIQELLVLREGGEDVPISGWRDSWHILKTINAEGIATSGENLAGIAEGEKTAREVGRFLKRHTEELPLLSRHLAGLSIQDEIISHISRTIGPDYEVLDSASSELSKIRKQINELRARLRRDFADFASKKSGGKGYEFVTMRGERYVVALPRNEAARVKGIVHQASASGASLYVEPLEFVEDNNMLESLVQEERREVERILRELTAEVFRNRDDLLGNQDVLLEIDLVSAKAVYARRYQCQKPVHSVHGEFILRGARHPLLEKRFEQEGQGRTVTPLDLNCDADLKALVISGPNAGGKTVALKTTGLLVMMDRSGLLIPCQDGTTIPEYDMVFADIGDDQSIEKSLSTFSSRIVHMKRLLELVNHRSLVLIDEIGDGTDPEEGAALAEAMLDRLIGVCGRVIVTTHLRKLKSWAHETPGAMNATLEFDPERLEPLFILRMGIPGRSWGIEMAGRMGLPRDIVDRAKTGLDTDALRMEELLAHLEMTERMVEKKRKELLKKENLLSEIITSYRSHLDRFREDREELVQEARKEALEIISSTRRDMENLVQEIRMKQAEREAIRRAHESMQARKAEFEKKLERKHPTVPLNPEDCKPGRWVEIVSLGQVGKILSIKHSSKVSLELKGGLRVETRVEDLAPHGPIDENADVRTVSWTTGPFEPVPIEIMVRGMEREEALEKVDAFLDKAVLQGFKRVVVIHGVGRGILKKAIHEFLAKDPRVEDFHPGEPARGGDGMTVVMLK